MELTLAELKEVLSLLSYSWKDVNFNYVNLTEEEKELISFTTFTKLVDLINLNK